MDIIVASEFAMARYLCMHNKTQLHEKSPRPEEGFVLGPVSNNTNTTVNVGRLVRESNHGGRGHIWDTVKSLLDENAGLDSVI